MIRRQFFFKRKSPPGGAVYTDKPCICLAVHKVALVIDFANLTIGIGLVVAIAIKIARAVCGLQDEWMVVA